jgi:hypothetical protein
MVEHPEGQCPGLSQCQDAWHEGGCEPYWQYVGEGNVDISGSPTGELDAVERLLWRGPDGPDDLYVRPTPLDPWVKTVEDGYPVDH